MRRANAVEIRAIMRLAENLKDYVRDSNDTKYAQLFLEVADALQRRAKDLAYGEKPPERTTPVNLIC